MKGKYTGILLVILNIALLGGIGYFYYQQDHVAPKIKVEEIVMVYEEGMEETALLEGVSAYDNEDGDLTARIIIEKIVTDAAKEKATITYGAVDSSGNISKATRTVKMKIEEKPEVLEEVPEENVTEEENAEAESDSQNDTQVTTEQLAQTSKTEQTKKPSQTSKTEQTNKPTQTNKPEQTKKPSQTSKTEQTSKPAQTNKPAQTEKTSAGNNKGPSIKFRDNRLKVNVGGKPAWVNIIEGLYDDKDDYVALFGTIKVNGNYDRNKPGTYPVQITVTDSDGNVSNAYPVEIVVE